MTVQPNAESLEAARLAFHEMCERTGADLIRKVLLRESDFIKTAITAFLSAERARGVELRPREPSAEMLDAVAPRPAHWPASGADKSLDVAVKVDQMSCVYKWRAMWDAAAGPDCLRKGPVETTAVLNEQSKQASSHGGEG